MKKELTELDKMMMKEPVLVNYCELVGEFCEDKVFTMHEWDKGKPGVKICEDSKEKYYRLKRVERKLQRRLINIEQDLWEQKLIT